MTIPSLAEGAGSLEGRNPGLAVSLISPGSVSIQEQTAKFSDFQRPSLPVDWKAATPSSHPSLEKTRERRLRNFLTFSHPATSIIVPPQKRPARRPASTVVSRDTHRSIPRWATSPTASLCGPGTSWLRWDSPTSILQGMDRSLPRSVERSPHPRLARAHLAATETSMHRQPAPGFSFRLLQRSQSEDRPPCALCW